MSKTKKILILTTDAGLGHQSAAQAIAEALRHKYGEACDSEIVNILEDERVPSFLRMAQDNYDQLVREYDELYDLGFRISDAAVPATLVDRAVAMLLLGVMRGLIHQYEPDVIVPTHPMCQMPLDTVYRVENQHIPFLTVVTDLVSVHRLWFDPAVDMCVVPTQAARDLALQYGLSEDQVEVIGIPVDPAIAAETRSKADLRADFGWQPEMETLLVVGGKRVSHLQAVLTALNHANLPLQVVAVAGGDEALYQRFMDTEWHGITHVYNFVENLPTMMLAADAIVCKAGGLIVTESLACGLPLLLVDVLPGQEEGNANYVIERGAAVLAESPVKALETLYHWFVSNEASFSQHTAAAQQLGRPRAAYDIAEKIWRI